MLLLYVLLLRPDLRLHDGSQEEADRIDGKQRRQADLSVEKCRDRHHHCGEGLQHTCDGVGLLEEALCDQQGIETLIGDHVDALDRSDHEAVYGKQGK